MANAQETCSLKEIMEESLFEILISNLIKDLSGLLNVKKTPLDTEIKRKQKFLFKLLLNCENEIEMLENQLNQIVSTCLFVCVCALF